MPTDIATLHRLVELEEGMTEEHQGTPLETSIPEGVDLSTWPITFEDDFNDISATITDKDGAGPWFTGGTYGSVGAGTVGSLTDPATPLYTQEGDKLGMGVRRDAGVSYWSSHIDTATFSDIDLLYDPKIGFAQQYGYFECRFKPADPTGSNAILWPAFWLYSISRLGGSIGNLLWKRIELDAVEIYNGEPGTPLGNDQGGHHFSVHFHRPSKYTAPGVWGRDVYASNFERVSNHPIWETDENFQFWHDYHTYGLLLTPEWIIVFFDGLEVGRFPSLEEIHQKYYLLVSNQIAELGSGGMPDGEQFTMLVDYVRCYQNPNWQTTTGPMLDRGALPGGGTANAKTFQTGTAVPSYAAADGASFVVATGNANTGAATANANGLGALPIFQMDGAGSPQAVPLSGGELIEDGWAGLRLDMSLDGGNGGWVLLNPGYSMKMPDTYVPPVLSKPRRVIDIEAIEAGLAEKHGIPGNLFPAGHPARTPTVVEPDVPPRMPTSVKRIIDTTVGSGEVVGEVTVRNTPDRPVRYALTNLDGTPSQYFDVDPGTGEYSVRAGAGTIPTGTYELALSAWPTPPQAIVPGSNATRINIEVLEDVPFDFGYFDQTRNLLLELDAQDPERLTVVSGKVAEWRDGSSNLHVAAQQDDERRPGYADTGLNGLPAVVSAELGTVLTMASAPYPTGHLLNVVTRSGDMMSANLHSTTRMSNTFDYLSLHMGAFVWSPGECTCWVNGVEVGLSGGGTGGISSTGAFFWVLDAASVGHGALGFLYDRTRLFSDGAGTRTLDAAVGQLAIVNAAVGSDTIDKCFGYLAHHWDLTGLLPAGHPYRSEAPRMWH